MSLDSIIAATENIVAREQHDAEKIDSGFSEQGARDSAAALLESRRRRITGWDAGEMGMTVAEAEAAFAKATTPEELAKVEADMVARAKRRASLATIDGKVAVAYTEESWHGLGVSVTRCMTAEEAIRLAKLDYLVEKRAVSVDGFGRVPGVFSVGKVVDGQYLPFDRAAVSDKYTIVQNHDSFSFLDGVVDGVGASYTSAGALGQGESVFLTIRLNETAQPVPGDEIFANLVLLNRHDGKGALKVFLTNHRPVCQNTARQAFASDGKGQRSISISHFGSIEKRVKDAKSVLFDAGQSFQEFADRAEIMAATPADPQHYADDVLDAVLEITAADALKGSDALAAAIATTEAEHELLGKRFDRQIKRRGKVLDDILTRHESETCQAAHGSVWSAYNAVTEYANHSLTYHGSGRREATSRFNSILDGRADEFNEAAYQVAESSIAN